MKILQIVLVLYLVTKSMWLIRAAFAASMERTSARSGSNNLSQ
jgi:hypothetical protein